MTPWPTWSRRCRLSVLLGVALVAGMSASLATTWLWWSVDPPATANHRGPNALWAGHTWVGDPHTEDDFVALSQRLRVSGISDVFFHVGPLEGNGTLREDRVPYARSLLEAMRRFAPEVRSQAYLGQVERRGGGPLDLRSSRTRANIAAAAESLLVAGFQGIHYDIEPIYPGDNHFLRLLDVTKRLVRQHGALLSVALEQIEVVPGSQRVVSWVIPRYHDTTLGFLRSVADRVDQLAVMTYDTGLPLDWLYGTHSAWQTCRIGEALAEHVIVFIGVPTHEEGSFWGFHPSAENERSGIRGVQKGLACLDDKGARRVGIAVFADWTTDEAEWNYIRRATE